MAGTAESVTMDTPLTTITTPSEASVPQSPVPEPSSIAKPEASEQ